MLTKEQNKLLVETDAGTPGGEMMRRYWQPAALSEELKHDAPLAVRLLGEDLVMFRNAAGEPQLIDRRCPHRGVDLSYGRVEDGGIRCLYHGWLMSGAGRCLDHPGEPRGSRYTDHLKFTAYPCVERAGIVFAYMGAGEPPELPGFPAFTADPSQVWASKLLHECNYLQGNEGNFDPQHISYLHRFVVDDVAFRPELNSLMKEDVAPRFVVTPTAFGLRTTAYRQVEDGIYARISNFIVPNGASFDGPPIDPPAKGVKENIGYQVHWHVPIDDGRHWKYTMIYKYDGPLDKTWIAKGLFGEVTADYRSPRNAGNRYLQDRSDMVHGSYAGLGRNYYDHDLWAVETQGRIIDRSRENLGATDKPLGYLRRLLLTAISDTEAGKDPIFVQRGDRPNAMDEHVVRVGILPPDVDLKGPWWELEAVS
jgi:phenylpropionate dioxygenase-like ring-hydroxylating dioxygenase large terminal subunit